MKFKEQKRAVRSGDGNNSCWKRFPNQRKTPHCRFRKLGRHCVGYPSQLYLSIHFQIAESERWKRILSEEKRNTPSLQTSAVGNCIWRLQTTLLRREWCEMYEGQWETNTNLEFFIWRNQPSTVKRNNNKNGRNVFTVDLHFTKCKKTFREKENDVGQKWEPKQKMKNTRKKLSEGKIMLFLFWIDLTNNCLFEIIAKHTHTHRVIYKPNQWHHRCKDGRENCRKKGPALREM